ncbi:MAG: hypothetical protein ACXWM4_11335 [Gemmatimonadaceae bacterium]
MAIALMILGNWRESLGGARANDKKSAVFGMKQTFSDKKTTFRRFQLGLRLACSVPPSPSPFFYQELFNDPQQTFRRHRNHLGRRPHRLFRHDRPEERMPGHQRLLSLPH